MKEKILKLLAKTAKDAARRAGLLSLAYTSRKNLQRSSEKR